MVHHVMAHFMAQHGNDFRRCAIVQQIVGQRDAHRSEKARDVGRDARRLLRGVEHIYVIGGDSVGAGHREDRRFQPAFGQHCEVVEQRRNVKRIDQGLKRQECDRDGGAPDPPAALGRAYRRVDDGQHDRESDNGQAKRNGKLPGPLQEGLIGQSVGVLARESLINRERQPHQSCHHKVLDDVDRHLQEARRPHADRDVPHLAGNT